MEELTIQNGEVRVDSDFYSLEKGVYLALYDEQGYFLYGRVPYGFDVQPEFAAGNLCKLNDRQKKWFVYDQFFKVDGENSVLCQRCHFYYRCRRKILCDYENRTFVASTYAGGHGAGGILFYRTNTSSGEADDQCGEEDSGRRKSVRKNRA